MYSFEGRKTGNSIFFRFSVPNEIVRLQFTKVSKGPICMFNHHGTHRSRITPSFDPPIKWGDFLKKILLGKIIRGLSGFLG
ncbi:MAG: hypothetical protein D6732_11495 [Methanobacteriota archaeon]|nr:MAG: hypothetical protein D6732_11495 [Euryarchaeota archaeon]